jgi:hypothetical protein
MNIVGLNSETELQVRVVSSKRYANDACHDRRSRRTP